MSLNLKGIKARPHDLDVMLAHKPALVELHCSHDDLGWAPTKRYEVPLAVHVPEYVAGELLDPASLDPVKRGRAEAVYREAVQAAVRWAPFFKGRPKVVFHPGGQTSDEEAVANAQQLADMRGALGQTTDTMLAAAGNEAEVLIENLPSVCWFFGGSWRAQHMTSGRELAAFCLEKKMGATLDLCHLHMTEHDVLAEIRAALPFVRHVHYSDARFRDAAGVVVSDEGLQINDGDMPLERYFAALAPLARLAQHEVFAVPEVWYAHEKGGKGFVEAWRRVAARLVPPERVEA